MEHMAGAGEGVMSPATAAQIAAWLQRLGVRRLPAVPLPILLPEE